MRVLLVAIKKLVDLGVGTIIDVFHWIRCLPKCSEQLKRFKNMYTSYYTVIVLQF